MVVWIPQSRLAYLTNKCYGEADLEYYIVEAGHILGLKLPEEADAKVGFVGWDGPQSDSSWKRLVLCHVSVFVIRDSQV